MSISRLIMTYASELQAIGRNSIEKSTAEADIRYLTGL